MHFFDELELSVYVAVEDLIFGSHLIKGMNLHHSKIYFLSCPTIIPTVQSKQYGLFSLPVIVGALGFFVDIYDLLLFNIVRRSSFHDLGVDETAMKTIGESVISWQMIGLVIGGIVW